MQMLHRLILTLIIQNNAAIRKVQRLQDLVTRTDTYRGIGDSRRLDSMRKIVREIGRNSVPPSRPMDYMKAPVRSQGSHCHGHTVFATHRKFQSTKTTD